MSVVAAATDSRLPRIRVGDAAASIAACGAVAAWAFGRPGWHASRISSFGLVGALDGWFFLAVGLLVVSFALAISRPRLSSPILVVDVVLLVGLLHGLGATIDSHASLPTTYTHAGFVEYIARTGHGLPAVDARSGWPGFFSFAAVITALAGQPTALFLLRWSPLVFNLLLLAPVFVVARNLIGDVRAAWVALWLFVIANWYGQDYFAPQAIALVLFLAVFAVATGPLGDHVRLARDALPSRVALPPALPARARQILVVLLAVIALAVMTGHQLTPVVLVLSSSVAVAMRRTRLRTFPILVGVLFLVWLSLAGQSFWTGHRHLLFGSVGHVSANVGRSVGRPASGHGARHIVLAVRLGVTALLAAVAAAGVARRWRAGGRPLTLVALALSPFPAVALQAYGGEVGIRAAMFATPFLAALAAMAFVPTSAGTPGRASIAWLSIVSLVLSGGFLLARYGNEQFEQIPTGAMAAVDWVLAHAPPGSTIVTATPGAPSNYRDIKRYDRHVLDEFDTSDVRSLSRRLGGRPERTYLIVSDNQQRWGELLEGKKANWLDRFRDELMACGCYDVRFHDPSANTWVFQPSKDRE